MSNQSIEELSARVTKLDAILKAMQREIAAPLLALRHGDTTIGAALLDKLGIIETQSRKNAATIETLQMQLIDGVGEVANVTVNTEELACKLTPYNAGYEIPASALRDTSRSWRLIITMLRRQATEHIAKSHLSTIGVTVKRKGKFIYFIKS